MRMIIDGSRYMSNSLMILALSKLVPICHAQHDATSLIHQASIESRNALQRPVESVISHTQTLSLGQVNRRGPPLGQEFDWNSRVPLGFQWVSSDWPEKLGCTPRRSTPCKNCFVHLWIRACRICACFAHDLRVLCACFARASKTH